MRDFALLESILWSPEPFWPSSLSVAENMQPDDFIFAAGKKQPGAYGNGSWEQHYFLLHRHMERLRKSASFFSFVLRNNFILHKLETLHAELTADNCAGNIKIRLLSAADGDVLIEYAPVAQILSLPVCFDISSTIPQEEPVMLAHKTTLRETFDREFERAMASGLFDTLFVNSQGKITQGCITNVFAAMDSTGMPLITPGLESGLLPGTLRAELISRGLATSGSMTVEMLRNAHTVYLGNSVRGLVPAVLRN